MPIIEEITDDEALVLKDKGNQAYKKGAFDKAEAHFSEALKLAEDKSLRATLLCNRAQARLKRNRPTGALLDARAALALDPASEKATYRKGSAELKLELYADAAATFARLRENGKDTTILKEAAAQEEVALQRKRERESGHYDWRKILEAPIGSQTDVAEHTGPIQVAHVQGKGRGLTVTRDVEAGELLFVNRAFALAKRDALGKASAQKLATCSRAEHDAFFLLCDGASTPQELPPLLLSRTEDEREDARDVDLRRTQDILDANAHNLDPIDLSSRHMNLTESNVGGLFLLGSLVNHSCYPSSTRVFAGDLMIVRAARDLRKGDEVTDGYISVIRPSFERRRMLKDRYGFYIADDRAVVEDALLPESIAQPLLERFDTIADGDSGMGSLAQLSAAVGDVVSKRIALLGAGDFPIEVLAAAARLTPLLERMLCGAFMAVFVGVAVVMQEMGKHAEAAAAYGRCCYYMEATAPHNALHVGWAVSAVLAARNTRNAELFERYVKYARKVLRVHYGPGVFEAVLTKHCRELGSSSLANVPAGETLVPPGFLHARAALVQRSGAHLQSAVEVVVDFTQALAPILVEDADEGDDVHVSAWAVRVKTHGTWATVVLPCQVVLESSASYCAKRSNKRQTVRVLLPAANAKGRASS